MKANPKYKNGFKWRAYWDNGRVALIKSNGKNKEINHIDWEDAANLVDELKSAASECHP